MMIIENEEVFNSIYNEFYKGEMQSMELLNKMLMELRVLSIIRMFNENFQWEIKLRALSINKVFIQDTYGIDNHKVVNELNKLSNNIIDDNKLEMIKEYGNQVQTVQDLLNITQGHDFSSLFAAICNIHTNKGIDSKAVEMALRCAYRNDDFKETRLYSSLLTYQKNLGILFLIT